MQTPASLITRRAWLLGTALGVAACARSALRSTTTRRSMHYDVCIVGGGPAGLSAALMLGRARRKVVLCDAGVPRNAAATHMHGFVTRDGIPPQEFRRLAWEQLAPYEVEKREARVTAIEGSAGEFRVQTSQGEIIAKRIVLAVGLIDEVPSLPGFRELWGHAIFQCPYCHAWEVQERPYGVILASLEMIPFVYLLRVWSKDLVVFPSGNLSLPEEARAGLVAAGVQLEERPIVGLRSEAGKLAAVQVSGGAEVAREFLFYRPAQHQPELVTQLGLALDSNGFLLVNEQRQTSITGIYAAGDSTTMMQSALNGAATGALAAAMLNHDLALSTIPGAASHTPSPAR